MILKFIISYLLYHTFAFPEYSILESVRVDSKTNGILVSLTMDSLPNEKNITGWQSKNDWFYITLYQCRIIKNNQLLKDLHSNILNFEIIENEESLQLGIKSREPIEQLNFSLNPNMKTITASLHFSTKFFAKENKDEIVANHNQNTGLSRGTRTWLNVSGIGLTLSGILKEEKVSNNSQTIAGLSIIVATFLLDIILKDF
ncbi:MAG: hypothetical protein CBB66_03450 [bacterium TMED6]|nr:MAG: hypothetical protein CBB66_03450 [bacterium TMED6]